MRSAWARANLLQPSQGTQLGTSHPSGDRLRHRDLAPAEIPVGIRTPYFQPACCQSDAHTYLRFLWVSFVLGAKPRLYHCCSRLGCACLPRARSIWAASSRLPSRRSSPGVLSIVSSPVRALLGSRFSTCF